MIRISSVVIREGDLVIFGRRIAYLVIAVEVDDGDVDISNGMGGGILLLEVKDHCLQGFRQNIDTRARLFRAILIFKCNAVIHRGGGIDDNHHIHALTGGQAGGTQLHTGQTGVLIQRSAGLGQIHGACVGVLGEVIQTALVHHMDSNAAVCLGGKSHGQILIGTVFGQVQLTPEHIQSQGVLHCLAVDHGVDGAHHSGSRRIALHSNGLGRNGNGGCDSFQYRHDNSTQGHAVVLNVYCIVTGNTGIIIYNFQSYCRLISRNGSAIFAGFGPDCNIGLHLLQHGLCGGSHGNLVVGLALDLHHGIKTGSAFGSFLSAVLIQADIRLFIDSIPLSAISIVVKRDRFLFMANRKEGGISRSNQRLLISFIRYFDSVLLVDLQGATAGTDYVFTVFGSKCPLGQFGTHGNQGAILCDGAGHCGQVTHHGNSVVLSNNDILVAAGDRCGLRVVIGFLAFAGSCDRHPALGAAAAAGGAGSLEQTDVGRMRTTALVSLRPGVSVCITIIVTVRNIILAAIVLVLQVKMIGLRAFRNGKCSIGTAIFHPFSVAITVTKCHGSVGACNGIGTIVILGEDPLRQLFFRGQRGIRNRNRPGAA